MLDKLEKIVVKAIIPALFVLSLLHLHVILLIISRPVSQSNLVSKSNKSVSSNGVVTTKNDAVVRNYIIVKDKMVSDRSYSNLEQRLCGNNIKKFTTWEPRNCPQRAIVTVQQGGRLGNQIWQYASVWALARTTGLEPYIPQCIMKTLQKVFEKLTVPVLEKNIRCPFNLNHYVVAPEKWKLPTQSIILPPFSFQFQKVLRLAHEIVQELTIRKELLKKSQQILKIAVQHSSMRIQTFVGVHVRRTDFSSYLAKKYRAALVGADYFKKAMEKFEEKYPNVLFIIVSDDPKWCWQKFAHKNNVYVVGKLQRTSAELDMAIMASCNHSIIDYGTFGQWGAILAGGETIYCNVGEHSATSFGDYFKNWYKIQ